MKVLPIIAMMGAVLWGAGKVEALSTNPAPSVLILYETNDVSGARRDVNQLRNLLGHFDAAVTTQPVDAFTNGQLARFNLACYLAPSARDTTLPTNFLGQVGTSTNTFLWINENIDYLLQDASRAARLGLSPRGTSNGYTRVSYKGEDLRKNTNDTSLIVLQATSPAQVLATAFSAATTNVQPTAYAIRSSNFFFIADNPFRRSSATDRSLVLADLLHDALRSGAATNHRALVRIEDVNPGQTSMRYMTNVAQALEARGIRATFGVIPLYLDPAGAYTNISPPDVSMHGDRPFVQALHEVTRRGHFITQHGTTHQNMEEQNVTALGYEFWNYGAVRPLHTDSWAWAAARAESGRQEVTRGGFLPWTWETPHYYCSLLDHLALGRRYRAQYERIQTFDVFADGLDASAISALSSQTVSFALQHAPYVIHRSTSGGRFLPENLDYYSPGSLDGNGLELNVSNKVAYARQLKVVRDSIASFYFHLQFGTNTVSILTDLVQRIQLQGFTFTDQESLLQDGHLTGRPESNTTASLLALATNIVGDLILGSWGTNNTMTISAGAAVTVRTTVIGPDAGSRDNLAAVSGVGSRWSNTFELIVGDAGSGNRLGVYTGALLFTRSAVLGRMAGTQANTAQLAGDATRWSNLTAIIIGEGGASNSLLISAGARLDTTELLTGLEAGAAGNRIELSGTGTAARIEGVLALGHASVNNTLTASNGATLWTSTLLVGTRDGADSNRMTLAGAGTALSTPSGAQLGGASSWNQATLGGGAAWDSGPLTLGEFAGSMGNSLHLSDSGTALHVDGELVVGREGSTQQLLAGPGTRVDADAVLIGDQPGASNNLVEIAGGVLAAPVCFVGRFSLLRIIGGDLSGTTVSNEGLVQVSNVVLRVGGLIQSPAAQLQAATGLTFLVTGDFLDASTNGAWPSWHGGVAFSGAGPHRLATGSSDLGAQLSSFTNNRALGFLLAAGTVEITNTVYAWNLCGSGTIILRAGAHLYYVGDSDWAGTFQVEAGRHCDPSSAGVEHARLARSGPHGDRRARLAGTAHGDRIVRGRGLEPCHAHHADHRDGPDAHLDGPGRQRAGLLSDSRSALSRPRRRLHPSCQRVGSWNTPISAFGLRTAKGYQSS